MINFILDTLITIMRTTHMEIDEPYRILVGASSLVSQMGLKLALRGRFAELQKAN